MNRDYTDGQSDNAQFFVGKEVEHTPAFGMKTLFIVGVHPIEKIEKLAKELYFSISGSSYNSMTDPIKHLFFGANHSFNPRTSNEWREWEEMIEFFLKKGYLCSLDIPVSCVGEFNDGGLNEYDNFIPQIRVPIPYVRLWNYNTMIKIDDKDFRATNPGVWSHSLHTLMDRKNFTDWIEYEKDKIVK
jgi:hypothetical protein